MNSESVKSRCPLCDGYKEPGKTTHTVDLGFGIVVIRNVPATVCSQCGEAWIDPRTAEELENIVEEAHLKHHEVQIVSLR